MGKVLACHAGGRGSNPDTTKDFSAPILLDTPTMSTLSLAMTVVKCYSMNVTGGKKRGIIVKILAVPFVRQKTEIRAMYWRKAEKRLNPTQPV